MALHLKSTGIDFADFGGQQGTGNELMDDYEEGTWTPVAGCGHKCTEWAVQSTQITHAKYIKAGGIVSFTAKYVVVKTGQDAANSFNMNLAGFPFATGDSIGSPGVIICTNDGRMGQLQTMNGTQVNPIRTHDNANIGNAHNPVTYNVTGSYPIN